MEKTKNSLATFEGKNIRKVWNNDEWWFSVVDIVEVLAETDRPRKYWSDLKVKINEEGSEVSEIIGQLKLQAEDGKMRETDCANTEGTFRIIQSIPSKKAEPFKLWLAKVGYERVQEIENPELAQNRAKKYYEMKGYPSFWIDKRLRGIAIRQELTNEWKERSVKEGKEFAILTNEITKTTFDKTVDEFKNFKGLKRKNQNLRDSMNDWEVILTMLGEKATTEITKVKNSQGLNECKDSANKGGNIARNAKNNIEKEIGKSVISKKGVLNEKSKRTRLK